MSDIRDVLVNLPHGDPDGATAYVRTDLFTVRHAIIKQLQPAPTSVFEFGALYGYFLVTALDAAPSIERVGWVDTEAHTPRSNVMCEANVRSVAPSVVASWTRDSDLCTPWFGHADLIQVDGDHSYQGCLSDLKAAHALDPSWIFIDDWDAETHRDDIRQAVDSFLTWPDVDYDITEHETVNGLAVLTRRRS